VLVVVARTLILYLIVVVIMRIMGKRQIGQLQPFELVIAIMISELASVPMQNTGIPLVNGIIPILTLLIAQLTLSFIGIKSTKARAIICGRPTVLVENGKIKESHLRKEMYTINDLMEQLRFNSIQNVGDVEYGILETNGQLSVLLKSEKRPATPEDLGINPPREEFSRDVIIDGKLIGRTLEKLHLKREWLDEALKEHGVNDYRQVFYAYIDSNMKLHLQKKGEFLE